MCVSVCWVHISLHTLSLPCSDLSPVEPRCVHACVCVLVASLPVCRCLYDPLFANELLHTHALLHISRLYPSVGDRLWRRGGRKRFQSLTRKGRHGKGYYSHLYLSHPSAHSISWKEKEGGWENGILTELRVEGWDFNRVCL